jgi:hypothetical protein
MAAVDARAVCRLEAAIARKLVPMLFHIMQTAEPFDRVRWQAAHEDTPYRVA